MEFLGCFFEVFEICLGVFELFGWIVEGVSWRKNKPKRQARRAARQAGLPLPPLDPWQKFTRVLFVILVVGAIYGAWSWYTRVYS